MNNQQMQMAGMANSGGPVGGAPLVQSASRGGQLMGIAMQLKMLNTYIYDYLIRHGHHDVARSMHKASKGAENPLPIHLGDGSSPSGKDVNGVDGADSKEDVKRPADLPEPGNKIGQGENCFLEDWWCQFWDLHTGARNPVGGALQAYIQANQGQQLMRQRRQNELVANNNQMMMYNRMAQQGMMPNEMQRAAMMNAKGPMNPAMAANFNRMKMAQQQMRDGQNPGMGEQRSQSPNANGDAPSPKRQRMDGSFNGQGMGPAGRGQGMPVQQPGMAGPNGMMLQNGMPDSFNAQQLAKMNLDAQGSPMPPTNGGDGGNHALQDYQMQLMLLEQQNKKRLLMARQEQDSMSGHPTGPMGQQFAPPSMSPQGSRQGPSPNPADQMKRGTPQMGQKGLPTGNSPAGMEGVQGNRASPAPPFDPNNMAPQFYPGMNPQMGGMGRPPSSHPGQFAMPPGMTPQQAVEFARRQQQQQQFPGMMGGPPPGAQMAQQPGQPQAMGTPRQQQTNMPPPPAPQAAGEQKTNPSSPNQTAAQPPTPSQTTKAAPKGGKKEKAAANKKGGNKKNQANATATPAADAEPPPTPTPSTPITPLHANSFKPGQGPAGAQGAAAGAQAPGAAVAGPQNPTPQNSTSGIDAGAGQPFGDGLTGDGNFNLDLASFDSGDVLDNFDFDTFLHNDDNGFADFGGMNFDEAGLTADGS